MALSYAPGFPDYSSTGTTGFIPEIWEPFMQDALYEATFLSEITNQDFENSIKQFGDSLYLTTTPVIETNVYVINQPLNIQTPTSERVHLTIDKARYYAFRVKKATAIQTHLPLLEKFSTAAGRRMAIDVEKEFLGSIYASADNDNKGLTAGAKTKTYNLGTTSNPVQISKTNILDYIVDCQSVLLEQNIPNDGTWWMVIPVWLQGMIDKSELQDASFSGLGSSTLLNGRLGKISNFTLYVSNLVPSAESNVCFYVMFGNKEANTWATQLVETDAVKETSDFGEVVRGLQIYGYKNIRAEGLGILYCMKASD